MEIGKQFREAATMNTRSMTDVEKRTAAKAFAETWIGRGDEKQDA
jgi:hypothetical protein